MLTNIAVRLRVITTSLLAIAGFVALGAILGFWQGYRMSSPTRFVNTDVPNRQWCDSSHTIPLIPANLCGGGSSCARAQWDFGHHTDWLNVCSQLNKSVQ